MPEDPTLTPADRKLSMARFLTLAAQKAEEAAALLAEAETTARAVAGARTALQQAQNTLAAATTDAEKAAAQADCDRLAATVQATEKAADDAQRKASEADAQSTILSQLASRESQWALRSLKERAVIAFSQLSTWVLIVTALVVLMLLWQVSAHDGDFLKQLADAQAARGLITFLIAGSTVSIAIILIYHAFAEGTTNEKFRFAREIFATLVGVLGTIVGFYFGIANDKTPGQPLRVDALKIDGAIASTSIASGTPPYAWNLTASEGTGIPGMTGKQDAAGTLNIVLPPPKGDGSVKLSIKDFGGNQLTIGGEVKKAKPESAQP